MSARALDGRALAGSILAEARRVAAAVLKKRGRAPRLGVVGSGGAAAASYVKAQLRACERAGVQAAVHRLSPGPRAKTLGLLADVVSDGSIDAVLIETPYPKGLGADDVAAAIPPEKDAEGVTHAVYGRLFLAKAWDEARGLVAPATAMALARLALASRVRLAGKRAVVLGRSATVGRPAAHLLSTLDLTVTLAHSRSENLAALCREADVLVAAAGVPGLVKPSWIKRGAVVLDAGIHSVAGKLLGDVARGAEKRAGWLTPVPGGVGPVTSALTVLNAALLASRR